VPKVRNSKNSLNFPQKISNLRLSLLKSQHYQAKEPKNRKQTLKNQNKKRKINKKYKIQMKKDPFNPKLIKMMRGHYLEKAKQINNQN
jgi:hypothetical protein